MGKKSKKANKEESERKKLLLEKVLTRAGYINSAGATITPLRDLRNNTSSSESDSDADDIPGYYYDKEKKNYFKILPNAMTSVSSFVTSETIKKKAEEDKRLAGLKDNGIRKKMVPLPRLKTGWKNDNLLSVLNAVQCGQPTCLGLQRYMMGQMCQDLKPQYSEGNGTSMTHLTPDMFTTDGIKRLELTDDCQQAVVVWSITGSVLQYMNLICFDVNKKTTGFDGSKRFSVHPKNNGYVGKITHKMSDMCWSPMSQYPDKKCVLYTTVCPLINGTSNVYIMDLECNSVEEASLFTFTMGTAASWSIAWNQPQARFSVGMEKKCQVIDVNSRSKWTYSTLDSDTLAQKFSPSNPNLLYAGTRNGKILMVDMRTSEARKSIGLNQNNSVACLKFFSDENYLLASDFSGLILNWDIRFLKPVRDYVGLVNSHYQLPFFLDETEQFLYATGSDGFCKIWDVSSGSLLNSIAPPVSIAGFDALPISHLSDRWGGQPGNYGLLTTVSDKLFEYC